MSKLVINEAAYIPDTAAVSSATNLGDELMETLEEAGFEVMKEVTILPGSRFFVRLPGAGMALVTVRPAEESKTKEA